MPYEIVFTADYGLVLTDASVPCVITQWRGFANATEFIALQEAALLQLETHSTRERPWGLVGDVRQMGAIPAKAQAWLIAEFNPRATAAGLREVSVVVSQTVFGQIATQRYAQETALAKDKYHLSTNLYESLEDAKDGARAAIGRK